MQTYIPVGTIIFVSDTSREATVVQEIEAHGLLTKWARNIRTAVDLLNSASGKTVVVTELALADGNWSDLVERVRCVGKPIPIVLLTHAITAELWWDALECGVEDILPAPLVASRLCRLLETLFTP
jgi:DNA-binding NtrC family response regulator